MINKQVYVVAKSASFIKQEAARYYVVMVSKIIVIILCQWLIQEAFLCIHVVPHLIFFHQHFFWERLGIAVDELHDIVVTLI